MVCARICSFAATAFLWRARWIRESGQDLWVDKAYVKSFIPSEAFVSTLAADLNLASMRGALSALHSTT